MKKKVRDRLDRIEQALNDLIREVRRLHPLPHRLKNDGRDDDASPALRTPNLIGDTGLEALRKKPKRTPK